MRSNVYRDKVLAILEKEHLLSIADIRNKLSGVDFSTIFRNVEQLVSDRVIKKVIISKDIVLYETVEKHAHDHFVCNNCGTVESVHLPKKIALKGKAIVDVLIRGTCKKCVR